MSSSEQRTAVPHAVERGIQQGMNDYAQAHELPYLRWSLIQRDGSVLNAQASRVDYDDAERLRVVEMWAEHLQLERVACALPAAAEWNGRFDGVPLVLWAVTDEAAFDVAVARLAQQAEQIVEQIQPPTA